MISNNRNAIKFLEENESYKGKGIYFQNTGADNEISISKENKEYIVGDRLYVEYKGMRIFTTLDNMILINKKDDTVQIIPYKELSLPEAREYLILIAYPEGSDQEDVYSYQGVVGRQSTFDYIKGIADEIDIEKSVILAETVALKDSISVYEFMKMCIEKEMVNNDDGFDIEEYI